MNAERRQVDGIFLPNFENASETIEHPIAFHYRFPSEGWAIFTVDLKVHSLAIQSDWGDCSYRWPVSGCGDTPFLDWLAVTCKGSADYVAGKMAYDSPQLKDQHDEDATRAAIFSELLEVRRSRDLTKEDMAEHWEDVKGGHWDLGSPDLMFATCPAWAWEMFESSPPMVTAAPGARVVLVEALLPFFGERLADYLSRNKAMVQIFAGADT